MNVFGEALLLAGAVGSGMSGMWAHEQTILASERAKCDRTHAEALRASQRAERAERARMEADIVRLVEDELSKADTRIKGLTQRYKDFQMENVALRNACDHVDRRLQACEAELASTQTSAQKKTAALEKALEDAEAALADANASVEKHAREYEALQKTSHETHGKLLEENAMLRDSIHSKKPAQDILKLRKLVHERIDERAKLVKDNVRLQAAYAALGQNARTILEAGALLPYAKGEVASALDELTSKKTAAVTAHRPGNAAIDQRHSAEWDTTISDMKKRLAPLGDKLAAIRELFESNDFVFRHAPEDD